MVQQNVVIVGGGLAGLSCAVELARAGVSCRVVEAADQVGGRVRTDVVEGFRLDRGFQVLLTAYPEALRLLDYESLDLQVFFPGALIRRGDRWLRLADPWRRPFAGIASVLEGSVSLADGLRMARLRSRTAKPAVGPAGSDGEASTAARLRAEGFSERITREFFRPFFGGVFLDSNLDTSERQMEFVFRMFSSGAVAVPRDGMEAIPRQLAARLPEGSVVTGTRVARVASGTVSTADGAVHHADAVVVATDGEAASQLVPGVRAPRWRSTACLYYGADAAPLKGPYLVLADDPEQPVNNLCVMSEVSGACAPAGRSLISASVLGLPAEDDAQLDLAVRRQLEGWFGAQVAGWQLLRIYRIRRALPAMDPPLDAPAPARLGGGLYLCGDHAADSSINGAMASGRRAAGAVLEDLGS
jgi:phytoene dehydrogenase-like protein